MRALSVSGASTADHEKSKTKTIDSGRGLQNPSAQMPERRRDPICVLLGLELKKWPTLRVSWQGQRNTSTHSNNSRPQFPQGLYAKPKDKAPLFGSGISLQPI